MVEATSVNPIDVRRRSGYGRKLFSLMGAARFPLVLGNDFVGIVTATGPGVSHFREGDAVFGAIPPSSTGTHASHVVMHTKHAMQQPKDMRTIPANALAALPYNFTTVLRALADAGLREENACGRDVLIHGASGRLGLLAVRTLANWGAYVTAVSNPASTAICRGAGAISVIDLNEQPLREITDKFAATLNFANWDDESALLKLLANDALGHATTVHPLLANLDQHGLLRGAINIMREKKSMRARAPKGARYAWTVFAPDQRALAYLSERSAIYTAAMTYSCFPLANAAFAHRHVEQRRPGCVVLLPT
ncbi:hypothetical protein GCM10011396_23140 [Undibacterium terreum]|uniref:Enoyl reductase (ER) domain-containing protein n=2 Tax=Undibacterium terreum TaxID=1224302 RepID=A0A916UK62_9BURK|nr:hypothetical protein GCM10011396_23140 [Undibacterium terreum]